MFSRSQYDEYVRSPEWAQKRAQRIRIDHGKCVACGKPDSEAEPLECHHLRYNTFMTENVWTDLCCLCPSCHEKVHALLNRCTGVLPDGTPRMGWRETLPEHIKSGLRKRGLM